MPEISVFRANAISYLRLPATDPERASRFYAAVFGWEIRGRGSSPAFTDGSGHVIGHFVSDQAVAGADGVRPYIYVDDLDATVRAIEIQGGRLATPPYPEGDLSVATFRDPEGNEIGIWQRVPRAA
jgi:predicted enzyme related to lactoylglutathione lyase